MKKLSILFLLVIILSTLTGCVQDSVNKVEDVRLKVEYVAEVGKLILSSTTASIALYDLYNSPLQYGTKEWKEDFYRNKEVIEQAQKESIQLNVPTDMQEVQNKFQKTLEVTVNANDTVATGIEKGENLTASATKQIADAINMFKSLSSTITNASAS